MLHQTLLLISCLSHSRLTIGLLLYLCIAFVFHSKEKLLSEKLPTKRDVIERVLNEENFLQQSAAGVVAKELINIWIFCNVYSVNEITVNQKIFALMKTLKRSVENLFFKRKQNF